MFSEPDIPPESLTVPSAIRMMNFSPFIGVNTSFALSLLAWISDASAPILQCLRLEMSPFQSLTACNALPRNIPGKGFRIDAVVTGLWQKESDILPSLLTK